MVEQPKVAAFRDWLLGEVGGAGKGAAPPVLPLAAVPAISAP
jgi:hypothetical protein